MAEYTLNGSDGNLLVHHMRRKAVTESMKSVMPHRIQRNTGFPHMFDKDIVKVLEGLVWRNSRKISGALLMGRPFFR